MFRKPFLGLRKREWMIWPVSIAVVTISALISGNRNIFTLITTLTGVSALIFAAVGTSGA